MKIEKLIKELGKYSGDREVYINIMDKCDSDYYMIVDSIEEVEIVDKIVINIKEW